MTAVLQTEKGLVGGRTADRQRGGKWRMFRLTLVALTRRRGYRLARGHGLGLTISAAVIGSAAIGLLTSAQAFAQGPGNPSRIAQEQHACTVVMGLHRPGQLYDTCIRSLDHSLSELDQAQAVSLQRSACAQKGFRPGTSAFELCVLNAEQSSADGGHYAAIAAGH